MIKHFKYTILVLLQLFVATSAISQQNDWASDDLDIGFFVQKYDSCATAESIDRVFEINDMEIVDVQYKQLNVIAYAKAIGRRGNHTKALEILARINEKKETSSNYVKGEYYGALGGISYSSENPEQAETYLKTSVEFLKKTTKKSDLQAKLISLGMVLTALENYQGANDYYAQAKELSSYGSEKSNLYLELNMAMTQSSSGNFKEAKSHFLNALERFKLTPDIYAEIRTYGNLADIYVKEDSLKIAEELFKKGLLLANKHGFDLGGVRFNRSLSDLYVKMNNPTLAYQHRVIYDSLRNALDLTQVASELTAMEKEHELNLKNIEISAQKERNKILMISAIVLFTLVLFLILQWKILKQKNTVLLRKSSEVKDIPKSKKILNEDQKSLIIALEKLVIKDRYYEKPNVTLERTAKKLNTNRTYLSEAVNECYEIGFSRWLNEVRVNESLKLLSAIENDKYSVEGIASMVGFSSISTFNSNFKSITGLTPSYFRKNRINVSNKGD